jgi:type I restriction enzyme R subunit
MKTFAQAQIPPVELFSNSFMGHVTGNSQGNEQAKASEMEQAILMHCRVQLDEDPASILYVTK